MGRLFFDISDPWNGILKIILKIAWVFPGVFRFKNTVQILVQLITLKILGFSMIHVFIPKEDRNINFSISELRNLFSLNYNDTKKDVENQDRTKKKAQILKLKSPTVQVTPHHDERTKRNERIERFAFDFFSADETSDFDLVVCVCTQEMWGYRQ
jgi:hypothetical protein